MRLPLLLCYIVQYGFHIYFPVIKFAPIVLFWNLCIENRLILADKLSLYLSDLCELFRVAAALGVIQHVKVYVMSSAACLG